SSVVLEARHGCARRSGAGHGGRRERRRWGISGGAKPPGVELGARVPEFEINQAANETIASPETPYLDPDDFADVPGSRGREGLPKAFRMRHASHYVEQLMGDAPIQSVRQIPIDQVVGPEVKADVSELVTSIREVGLLQPLLVTSREPSRFELLAGRHRLSAARQAGLSAVPCLLVNADEEAAGKLKAHTERK